MIDAYDKLFEKISRNDFFKHGIEDMIFVDENKIKEQWETIKKSLNQGDELFIRGYGRDGKNTDMFFTLYQFLFSHKNIKRDANNNAYPTKILSSMTNYSKKTKKDENKLLINNYRIAHLFGRTKNPLLFGAAWNIAYVPEYIDAFTGHESQGKHSAAFKVIFHEMVSAKFKVFIEEYNQIIENVANDNLQDALKQTRKQMRINKSDFVRFERDANNELSPIPIKA